MTVNEAALATAAIRRAPAETVTGDGGRTMRRPALPAANLCAGGRPATAPTAPSGFNPNGTYSYTLTRALTEPDANNGANTGDNVETFTYQATDANGNTATGTITVNIVDDVPTANADTDSVTEGARGHGQRADRRHRRRVRRRRRRRCRRPGWSALRPRWRHHDAGDDGVGNTVIAAASAR